MPRAGARVAGSRDPGRNDPGGSVARVFPARRKSHIVNGRAGGWEGGRGERGRGETGISEGRAGGWSDLVRWASISLRTGYRIKTDTGRFGDFRVIGTFETGDNRRRQGTGRDGVPFGVFLHFESVRCRLELFILADPSKTEQKATTCTPVELSYIPRVRIVYKYIYVYIYIYMYVYIYICINI